MEYTKLPEPTVVRVIKCLDHGCSVEATADFCEVEARTGERLLDRAGTRDEDFHRLQLERLVQHLEAVERDERHARESDEAEKKGRRRWRKCPSRDHAAAGASREVEKRSGTRRQPRHAGTAAP